MSKTTLILTAIVLVALFCVLWNLGFIYFGKTTESICEQYKILPDGNLYRVPDWCVAEYYEARN